MSNHTSSIVFTFLGQECRLRINSEHEHWVREIEQIVADRISTVQKNYPSPSQLKTSIFTNILLAQELYLLQQEHAHLKTQVAQDLKVLEDALLDVITKPFDEHA